MSAGVYLRSLGGSCNVCFTTLSYMLRLHLWCVCDERTFKVLTSNHRILVEEKKDLARGFYEQGVFPGDLGNGELLVKVV